MMSDKDRKNLNTFEAEQSNSLMKYPKIPAVIANTFKGYGSAESLIKHIFLYLLRHYQSFNLSTFIGPKLIEIDPETLAAEMRISASHLLKKTINCDPPYMCHQIFLTSKKLPLDISKWDDTHKALYKKTIQSQKPLYDTVLTDALYRMWNQKIEIKKITDLIIKEKWNENYLLEGFSILEKVEISQKKAANGRAKITSIRASLSTKLIEETLSFFTLIQPEEYKKLLAKSKGHTEPANLYTHISTLRNVYFFGQGPKDEYEPYAVPFWLLCEKANLKYKKEPHDKDHWRYKEARKSLSSKLEKITGPMMINGFEIEKANAAKSSIRVWLWFTPPNEEEKAVIAEFHKQRLNIKNQKWLSTVYMEQLKPGSHPWDEKATSASEIIEKYCNEEYYHHWLANKDLHKEEKEKAVIAGYTEIFPNAKQPMSVINKALDEFYQVGKKSLEENDIALIKTSANAKINEAFTDKFKIAHKSYFNYDYVAEELPDDIDIPKWDLKLLYTFFACDHFKKKTMAEFVKHIRYIQTRGKEFCKGKDFMDFLKTYCTAAGNFYENILIDLNQEVRSNVLEALKGSVFWINTSLSILKINIDLKKEECDRVNEIVKATIKVLEKIHVKMGQRTAATFSFNEKRLDDDGKHYYVNPVIRDFDIN